MSKIERPADIDRLPRRLRSYIENLEARLRDLEKTHAEQPKSRIAEVSGHPSVFRYLDSRAVVRYYVGVDPEDYIDIQMKDIEMGRVVEIYVGMSNKRLAVLANSSNVMYAALVDKRNANANRKK